MIELTEQQMQALERADADAARLVNPRTKQMFVLVPAEEYERLKEGYDDAPWTREEIQTLAWQAAEREGWDEYDDEESESP